MNRCYLCGISDEKALLYEGISKTKGIVNVCRKCFFKDKMPLIVKKEIDFEKINSRETVKEKLSRIAHLSPTPAEHVEDKNLKKLIEENFKRELASGQRFPDDLIENYHWVIMRKRRIKGITKEKLAERISEPLIAIESLERGILPKDYSQLIKKVENFFEIRLYKNRSFDHNDIIAISKMNSRILMSELQKKNREEKEKYIDVSNLSLDEANEVYSTIEKLEKERNEKKSDDVSRLAWGR